MTDEPATRIRREPPAFRRATVGSVHLLTPRLARVTLTGPDLSGLVVDQPAASVRLLLPGRDGRVQTPVWNGNEFRLPDGARAPIRTFTPVRVDPVRGELDLDVVLHDGGVAARWAREAVPGSEAAVSGPGRGYDVDRAASSFVIAGDETAVPAMRQVLACLPAGAAATVIVELAHASGRLDFDDRAAWIVRPGGAPPGDAVVTGVREAAIDEHTRVWVAGEAAAVQRVRRYLFEERGLPRTHAWVRGYWKHGRAGDGEP